MIDLAILSVIGISTVYSLLKGMTKELFSLAALLAGYFFAGQFSKSLSVHFNSFIQNSAISTSISYIVIFFVVSLIVKIIGDIVRKTLKISATLSFADRIVGAIIGVLKGALIISILMIPLNFIPTLKTRVVKDSKYAPIFIKSSRILTQFSSDSGMLKNSSDKAKKLIETLKKKFGSELSEKFGNLDNINLDGINLENIDMDGDDFKDKLKGLDLNNLPGAKTDLNEDDQKSLENLLKELSK